MGRIARALAVGASLACAACRAPGCVELLRATPVLEEPFPLWYDSTNASNRVLATLQPGRIQYYDSHADKDFLALHVRLGDGRRGYVIWGSSMKECAP